MSDDPVEWKIQTLRGQLLELGSAIRQLDRSGLDSATAQLLLSRKRAELDDLIKRGCGGDIFCDQQVMFLPQGEIKQVKATGELKD